MRLVPAAAGALSLAAALYVAPGARADRAAGSSSLIIGKLPVGSRAIALSGAYSAIAAEPAAVFWNAAGLARMSRPRLEIMHIEHGEEIRTENLLYSQPVTAGGTAGFCLSFLNMPPIQQTLEDAYGNYLGEADGISAYQFKVGGGFGQDLARVARIPWMGKVWANGLVGAAVSVLGESIGEYRSYSVSFDLGYIFEDAGPGRSVGVVLRQVGFPADELPLPVTGQFGVAQIAGDWQLMADLLTATDDAFRVRFGAEWFQELSAGKVTLRGGVQHSFSSELLAPYAAGLGYMLKLPAGMDFEVEYAFAPVQDLQPLHALSVNLAF